MWDFSVGQTLGLVARTLPFIVFRIIVYFGIAVAYVLVTGIGVGIGWGVGAFGSPDFRLGAMGWGGIIGFALTAGTIWFLREYILYIVKAGHIAVLVELLDGRDVPQGQGQINYATEIVRSHFAETNVLFGVDLLIRGVLAAILGLIQGLALTVVLGILFTSLQAWEYAHAPFGFKDGIYTSTFFMATGFHGFHVIIGTTFLIVCLFRAIKGHFTPDHHFGFEGAAWYWHFVDVVWLGLFIFVYWLI